MKKILVKTLLALLLTACGSEEMSGPGPMMGMGDGSGMEARHHAQVPEPYAGVKAPEVTEESLISGEQIYTQNCVVCHGETGMGDGPVAASLDPAPAPIGHTTQMLADDLVFYRVSEGGIDFETSMPAWKNILTEDQRWDVIAYVRVLGTDNAMQMNQMRMAEQDAMLSEAVSNGVLTQNEADSFKLVHDALEGYMQSNVMEGDMNTREAIALQNLVDNGTLTQDQVDEFQHAHDLLASSGMMR